MTRPIPDSALMMFGNGDRNWAGISTALRPDQIRSPSTLFEAQLRVDRGCGKNTGLITIQVIASSTAIRLYQPIQSRLQTASAISDSTLNRVQTLSAFAWRIHLSPVSPNRRAIRCSCVGRGVVAA